MSESITAFFALDVHKESLVIALARSGRAAPRFAGTTATVLPELAEALARLCRPSQLLMVYEGGSCSYGFALQL